MKYKGITTKKMKDGSTNIMVRFKYLRRTYSVKNFTRLYGCTTQSIANQKLIQVKQMISEGKDPFVKQLNTLNDLFDQRLKILSENETWSKSTQKDYILFYNRTIRNTIGMKKPNKVTYEDIMKIINSFKATQFAQKNKFINILNPIFEEEIKKKTIFENHFNKIKKFKKS